MYNGTFTKMFGIVFLRFGNIIVNHLDKKPPQREALKVGEM